MDRLFVSHSGMDTAPAGDVHRWTVDDGHDAFLDQYSYDGMWVGEQWRQGRRGRLRWADAITCVLSAAYTTSVRFSQRIGGRLASLC